MLTPLGKDWIATLFNSPFLNEILKCFNMSFHFQGIVPFKKRKSKHILYGYIFIYRDIYLYMDIEYIQTYCNLFGGEKKAFEAKAKTEVLILKYCFKIEGRY